MRAGELKYRITLQKPIHTRSSFQEDVVTYSDVATVYAGFQDQRGRLFLESKQLNSEIAGIIKIRYRSDIRPEWRLKYGDRYLKILALVDPGEQREELLISYKEARD